MMRGIEKPGKRGVLVVAALFFTFAVILTAPEAVARPFRLAKLPGGGQNASCGTCHVNPRGGGARNGFGKDYQRIAMPAGDTYTRELGERDSDGDGFTNDQEFAAGTKPEDPTSKP